MRRLPEGPHTGSTKALRTLLTPRWLLGHLLAAALVAAMLWLAWWQIGRARDGNALSIGYSLEWPVFAAFVVFFWVKTARRAVETERAGPAEGTEPAVPQRAGPAGTEQNRGNADRATGAPPGPRASESTMTAAGVTPGVDVARRLAAQRAAARDAARTADPETASYNHYLSWLNANPHLPVSDYPGMETP